MELIAIIIALIVPIGVAIWTVRSSAKDTAKKIAALEESTQKQIDSIKELSRQMIETTIKQVELQIHNNLTRAKQAKQEWEGIQEINNSGMPNLKEWKDAAMNKLSENKPERDYKIYCDVIKELEELKKALVRKVDKLN